MIILLYLRIFYSFKTAPNMQKIKQDFFLYTTELQASHTVYEYTPLLMSGL